jgi:hypothetical protein
LRVRERVSKESRVAKRKRKSRSESRSECLRAELERERETERGRQRGRQRQRETERDREAERQRDRETERDGERERAGERVHLHHACVVYNAQADEDVAEEARQHRLRGQTHHADTYICISYRLYMIKYLCISLYIIYMPAWPNKTHHDNLLSSRACACFPTQQHADPNK